MDIIKVCKVFIEYVDLAHRGHTRAYGLLSHYQHQFFVLNKLIWFSILVSIKPASHRARQIRLLLRSWQTSSASSTIQFPFLHSCPFILDILKRSFLSTSLSNLVYLSTSLHTYIHIRSINLLCLSINIHSFDKTKPSKHFSLALPSLCYHVIYSTIYILHFQLKNCAVIVPKLLLYVQLSFIYS